jgi:hypothetical protein
MSRGKRFESARRLSNHLSKRIYIFQCHILEHETAMMLNLKEVSRAYRVIYIALQGQGVGEPDHQVGFTIGRRAGKGKIESLGR